MAEILAIANRRGGAGKTVTAHAIGAGLARSGHKVLFVDLDSQCNLTFDLAGAAAPPSAFEVLTGTAAAPDAVQHAAGGDLIAGSPSLAAADTVIEGTGKEYRLREALQPIAAEYDYIIIDTPPALGVLTVNALTSADGVIIPAQAEIHSIQGIGLLREAVEAVQKYTNPALRIYGIVLTRFFSRSIIARDMRQNMEAAAAELGAVVFNTPIRECSAIKEAQAVQRDIFSYAPRSNAAADYAALLEDIQKER